MVSYADGRVTTRFPASPIPSRKRSICARSGGSSGVWDEAELQAYGLKIAVPFDPPAGKIATGAARFVEDGDTVIEQYDLADEPEPEPPPTVEQRVDRMLGDYGLSRADLLTVLLPPDGASTILSRRVQSFRASAIMPTGLTVG